MTKTTPRRVLVTAALLLASSSTAAAAARDSPADEARPLLLIWLLEAGRDPLAPPLEAGARYSGVAADPPTSRAYLQPPRPQMELARTTRLFLCSLLRDDAPAAARDVPDRARSLALFEIDGLDRSQRRATGAEIDPAAAPLAEVLRVSPILRGLGLGAGGVALDRAIGIASGPLTLGAGPSMVPAGFVLGGSF